ncbi:MAG: hypothetical protein NPIRA03_18940 [Nitrospirales bacterium]|nr:MAG: hypothetical protein NPIRA03_18940 [Nitrospirales bacterium]
MASNQEGSWGETAIAFLVWNAIGQRDEGMVYGQPYGLLAREI